MSAKDPLNACVDDSDRTVNPMSVEGQVHGTAAYGIGAALMEDCRYDEDDNILTSTSAITRPRR